MTLIHLASRLYGTPLLIARPKLDVILSVLGSRIGLHDLALPDLDMAMPTPRPANAPRSAGIAVIPVVGEPDRTSDEWMRTRVQFRKWESNWRPV